MRRVAGLFLAILLVSPGTPGQHDSAAARAAGSRRPLLAIPARPPGAPGATRIVQRVAGLPARERDALFVAEAQRGNVPAFLRRLNRVVLRHRGAGGEMIVATVRVMPDYLAVGSDEDFLRAPLSFQGAASVARAFDMTFPTRKIVDAVARQSTVRLGPRPMRPGPLMTSTAYFREHQQTIEAQLEGHDHGELVSGHKKDLVLTNLLARKPSRVAIYGWHRLDGTPIQPLSIVHGAGYADYSHGLRLISTVVEVDGVEMSIFDVLSDPRLAPVLSYEGEIKVPPALIDP